MQNTINQSIVAFSGSRFGSAAAAAFLDELKFSGTVLVGCAAGVDALVRARFSDARIFSVSSYGVGRFAFAKRSAAMVRALAAGSGSRSGLLVAFPSGSCPKKVKVSTSFYGAGSGSWGSVAFAIGLGCPVWVFVPVGNTVGRLPLVPGPDVSLGGVPGVWWSFTPKAKQLSLFDA